MAKRIWLCTRLIGTIAETLFEVLFGSMLKNGLYKILGWGKPLEPFWNPPLCLSYSSGLWPILLLHYDLQKRGQSQKKIWLRESSKNLWESLGQVMDYIQDILSTIISMVRYFSTITYFLYRHSINLLLLSAYQELASILLYMCICWNYFATSD